MRGFSLLESVLVLGLLALTAAIALPSILGGLDDARAVAAARHVAGLVRLTRVQAAARSTRAGLRFEREGATYRYAVYVDANGNGLRQLDGVGLRVAFLGGGDRSRAWRGVSGCAGLRHRTRPSSSPW